MFIISGKAHCCNDTVTNVRFTSLLANNIKEEYKLFLCRWNQHFISYFVWNFHSNWILFLRVMQENKKWMHVFCFWKQCTVLDHITSHHIIKVIVPNHTD